MTNKITRRRLGALTIGALAAPMLARNAHAQALADMVKAAQAEGTLTIYSSATENVARRTAEGFTAKYGVKAQFLRLAGSTPLQQRFSAEADAGTPNADVIFSAGGSLPFAHEGVSKGWMSSIGELNLPSVVSGQFPDKFNDKVGAIIQIAPWQIAYNTEKVKGDAIPKNWGDVFKTAGRGDLLIPDPGSSDAYLDLWATILDDQGPGWFAKAVALQPRKYTSGVPAVQSLAAGEGMFQIPTVAAQARTVRDKGAPIDTVMMEHTAGVEMRILVTSLKRAPHPNAARLMAEYVMSPEGNKVFNDEPGSLSVYGTSALPKRYVASSLEALKRKDEFRKLLGFA